MAGDRRRVRAARSLFEDLDRQLPAQRSGDGTPSAHDFLAHDLLRLIDVFAVDFEGLLEAPGGRPAFRVLITAGQLVPRFSIVGHEQPDGSIELIRLEIDLDVDS